MNRKSLILCMLPTLLDCLFIMGFRREITPPPSLTLMETEKKKKEKKMKKKNEEKK